MKREQEQKAKDIYVTDALYVLARNASAIAGMGTLDRRYIDILNQPLKSEETGEEIAARVIKEVTAIERI